MVVTDAPIKDRLCSLPAAETVYSGNPDIKALASHEYENFGRPNMYNATDHSISSDCEESKDMEFNMETKKSACCDAPAILLETFQGTKTLDQEGRRDHDEVERVSRNSEADSDRITDVSVFEKVDESLASFNPDTQVYSSIEMDRGCRRPYMHLNENHVDILENPESEVLVAGAGAGELDLMQDCCPKAAEDGQEGESSKSPNVQPIAHTFSRENEGTGADGDQVAPSDDSSGGNGNHISQNEESHNLSEKLSEHSEDDGFTSATFSGPIAFSGAISYSGMISYSGQIPYSGNLSYHSDSSTSTRSFAFPILASDWNASPAKIGQPDTRYFRRRRRWRACFCCKRPTTLFD